MGSLAILAVVTVVCLILSAIATAFAARHVGSARGRFSVAFVTLVVLQALAMVAATASAALSARVPEGLRNAIGLGLVGLDAGLALAAFAIAFRLSFGRTFAPFGAFVAVQILTTAFAFGVLRRSCVESFVGTRSMSPTILPTDAMMADKWLAPRRGDVIAYRAVDPRAAGRVVYCKRLLGLPGERLCITDGGLTVDGRPVALPSPMAGRLHAVPATAGRPATPLHPEGEAFTLGADDYFVVGDDVDRSVDSRLAGPIHGATILGVVDLIYWPLSRARILR